MLTTLNKYLLKQNLLLVCIILFAGISVYLIVDFVTRMNAVVESGIGMTTAVRYFSYKVLLIISQIMPAIFMLAVIVQVALMHRNNEIVALEAGSISFVRPALFFITYSVLVFMLLLSFSETLGIKGYQITKTIWDSDIRHRQVDGEGVSSLWFKEEQKIVNIQKAWPDAGHGIGIKIFVMDGPDRISTIIEAPEFTASRDKWILNSPMVQRLHEFDTVRKNTLEISLSTELGSFSVIASRLPYDALSIFTLRELINQLRESGSNVERLATAWHGKFSYPFALVIMTVLGLALTTLIRNIYALVTLSLVIVFLYYTVYVFGVSYAEEGLISPFWGAWLANILFGTLGMGQILWAGKD